MYARTARTAPHGSRPSRRIGWTLCALATATTLMASGCADFSEQDRDRAAGPYSSNPVPDFIVPEQQPPPPPGPELAPPPEGPCVDPDQAVIATCLESTGGVHPADPEGQTTYVAERTTGRILISKRYGPQREIAKVAVDGSGDGGLVDFAFSPTYEQDRLIYALITTGSDNRVVRIAPGNDVKPILTGIPKGADGNMGSMFFRGPLELVVATGDAGDPSAADNRSSLAGKVLTLDPNNPRPGIVASGFGSDVALCPSAENGKLYVADSGSAGDRLFELEESGPKLLWQWEDRPGVAGCAVVGEAIYVSMSNAARIDTVMAPTTENPTVAKPTPIDLKERFGAIGRLAPIPGAVQLATVNKSTPDAKVRSTDDRVAIFFPPQPQSDLT